MPGIVVPEPSLAQRIRKRKRMGIVVVARHIVAEGLTGTRKRNTTLCNKKHMHPEP
jgi:hypothetical protein